MASSWIVGTLNVLVCVCDWFSPGFGRFSSVFIVLFQYTSVCFESFGPPSGDLSSYPDF